MTNEANNFGHADEALRTGLAIVEALAGAQKLITR